MDNVIKKTNYFFKRILEEKQMGEGVQRVSRISRRAYYIYKQEKKRNNKK